MKICFFQLVVENASLDLEDRSTQTLDLPRWRQNNLAFVHIGRVNIICVNGCVMIIAGRRKGLRVRRSHWQRSSLKPPTSTSLSQQARLFRIVAAEEDFPLWKFSREKNYFLDLCRCSFLRSLFVVVSDKKLDVCKVYVCFWHHRH